MGGLNILVQNPFMKGGGAENRIRLLLEALVNRYDVNEVHFMFTGAQTGHQVQAEDKLHFWQIRKSRTLQATKKLLKDYRIDVVQLHNNQNIGTDGLELAQKVGIPTVHVVHDVWSLCANRFMMPVWKAMDNPVCEEIERDKCVECVGQFDYERTKRQREVINNCDVGIAPSQKFVDMFERNGVLEGRWEVVHPWIKLDTFNRDPNIRTNPWQVMFAGNFIPHKGIQVLLNAWSLVQKRLPMARLKAQGDQRSIQETLMLRENLKLRNVEFMKRMPQEQLNKLYNESTLLVFPSIWPETIGLIWGEALSTGTPVIASETGSISELLKYGGVTFPRRDHVKLAESIVDLLLSPRRRRKMAREGYEYVRKNFTKERAAQDFIEIYSQLEMKI